MQDLAWSNNVQLQPNFHFSYKNKKTTTSVKLQLTQFPCKPLMTRYCRDVYLTNERGDFLYGDNTHQEHVLYFYHVPGIV
jgi:hypothetical protein